MARTITLRKVRYERVRGVVDKDLSAFEVQFEIDGERADYRFPSAPDTTKRRAGGFEAEDEFLVALVLRQWEGRNPALDDPSVIADIQYSVDLASPTPIVATPVPPIVEEPKP